MNEPVTLDPAAIERLRKLGGDKFAAEMIGLFFSYGGKKMDEARQAQQAGNMADVASAAHPLKSSAGNVGALRVQSLAALVEQSAKAGNSEAVAAQMKEFEKAYAEAKALLETEKARLKPASA